MGSRFMEIRRMTTVALHAIAHARAGDKGNRSSISVIAYDAAHFELLVEQVTEARVMQALAHRRPTRVTRYVLPKLHAMNFVIDDVLDGGVNSSLNLDTHGKALAFIVLEIELEVSPELLDAIERQPPQEGKA
jgi:hypothetical protein